MRCTRPPLSGAFSTASSFFTIDTSTYAPIAMQMCVFAALSLVLKKALVRRGCLIHWKDTSIGKRDLERPVIVGAGIAPRLKGECHGLELM